MIRAFLRACARRDRAVTYQIAVATRAAACTRQDFEQFLFDLKQGIDGR